MNKIQEEWVGVLPVRTHFSSVMEPAIPELPFPSVTNGSKCCLTKKSALQPLLLVHWQEGSLSGSGTETCALGPEVLACGCKVGTCDRHAGVGVVI